MKISKRQLHRIIREEVAGIVRSRSLDYTLLDEPGPEASLGEFVRRLEQDTLAGEGIPMSPSELRALYSDWQDNVISWDDARAEVAELAF